METKWTNTSAHSVKPLLVLTISIALSVVCGSSKSRRYSTNNRGDSLPWQPRRKQQRRRSKLTYSPKGPSGPILFSFNSQPNSQDFFRNVNYKSTTNARELMDIIPIRNDIIKWAAQVRYQFDEKPGEITVWVGKERDASKLVIKVLYDDGGIVISGPAASPRKFTAAEFEKDASAQTTLVKLLCRSLIQAHAHGNPSPGEVHFGRIA